MRPARSGNAGPALRHAIESMPERSYVNANEVLRALGLAMAWSLRLHRCQASRRLQMLGDVRSWKARFAVSSESDHGEPCEMRQVVLWPKPKRIA